MIVERKNGEIYELNKYGIFTNNFEPDAPEPDTTTSERTGVDGHIDLGTTYKGRRLNADMYIVGSDFDDYALMRHDIFRIFDSKESFNLIHESEPNKKWINCKYTSAFSISRLARRMGEFSVQFQSTSPYAHSRGSLLDPYTFESELWQFGMNIPLEDFGYTHTTRKFDIWNLGDKEVNPRNDMLEIYFKGASNKLKITNLTTGDTWQYYGTSKSGDTIMLDRVFARKNGSSIFNETNHNCIRLAPGKNEFILTGATEQFEISFDFRFLYL